MDPSGPTLTVRLRGAVAAVEAACQRMLAEVPGQRMDQALAAPDWQLCRNQQLPFFSAPAAAHAQLWRISLPQTAPVLALPGQPLIEWHGALRWLWAPVAAATELQALAQAAGGSASLFVAPQAGHSLASSLRSASPALQAISQRLKASFDPQGLFNPGLL